MKLKALLATLLLCSTATFAQDDPVIMTIAGRPVARSEFEYSYNKNNAEGVIDKKTVEEYVDLFVNYKLKVQAAIDAQLDTLTSFKQEFCTYRNQQLLPSFVSDADVEKAALDYYTKMKANIGPRGLFTAWHILLTTPHGASAEDVEPVKARIDSIYAVLKAGADFEETAKQFSQDPGTAGNGGLLPTFGPGQTVKEFEDVAYSLKDGEMSKPFKSDFGYHIIKMKERSQVPPFDSLQAPITMYLESNGLREKLALQAVDSIAKARGVTTETLYNERTAELSATDESLKYLIQEYHDGLLYFEMANRTVWEKGSKDEAGLKAYFTEHQKKYTWEEPRFKGIAYHVKEKADVKAVVKCIKKIPFKDWGETLRTTFNNDSVIRIRVEKGIFKKGDNKLVDIKEFAQDAPNYKPNAKYPIDATYGKMLTVPEELDDVRSQVVTDYQNELDKAWVEALRNKYPVEINQEVLATVNKH